MSDSGIQTTQTLDNINTLLTITNEPEMLNRISKNIQIIIQIFNSFKSKLNFGQISNKDINQIIETLKFIDNLNLFMEDNDVNRFKLKMGEIRDLLNKYNYDFKDSIIKQINYTEMTIINHRKLFFRNMYFNNHQGLSSEIETELDQVYKGNKFDFRLFKQMQNIFWVVKNVIDEDKKTTLDNRLKIMKAESLKIKEKKFGGNYLNRGYKRNDNYINDYNDHKGYSIMHDYNDNFSRSNDILYYNKYINKGSHYGGRGGYQKNPFGNIMNNSNRKYYIKKQEEKEIEIPSDPSYYSKYKEDSVKLEEINDNYQEQNNNNNINGGNEFIDNNSNSNNNFNDINFNGGINPEINNNSQNINLNIIQNNDDNGANGEVQNNNININNNNILNNDQNKNNDIEIISGNPNISQYNRNKKNVFQNKVIAVEVPLNENNNNEDNNNGAKLENNINFNNEDTFINNSNNYNYNGDNNLEIRQYNTDNKYKNYYYNNGYKSNNYNKRNNFYNNRYNPRNNLSGNNMNKDYYNDNKNKKMQFVEIDANNMPIENKDIEEQQNNNENEINNNINQIQNNIENNEVINGQENDIINNENKNENNEVEQISNEPNGEVINNNEVNDKEVVNTNINNDINNPKEILSESKEQKEIIDNIIVSDNNKNNNDNPQINSEDIQEQNKEIPSEAQENQKDNNLKSISENINLGLEDNLNTQMSKSDSHINKISNINSSKGLEYNIPETEEENLQEQQNHDIGELTDEENDMPENVEGQFRGFIIESLGVEPKGSFKLKTNDFEENEENEKYDMDNNNFDINDLDEHINDDIENDNLMNMNDAEQEKEIKLKECMDKLNIHKIITDALEELEEEERQLRLRILHKLDDNYKNDAINPKYTLYKNAFFQQNSQIFSNELIQHINEYKSNPSLSNIPLNDYLIAKYYNNAANPKDNDIIKEYIYLKIKEIEEPQYIWNNMQNFEKKILIPLYQKTINSRKKKYNTLNHIYHLYERNINYIFQNSKDALEEVEKFGAFSNTFMIDFGEPNIDICLVPKCTITYFRNTYIEKLKAGLRNNKLGSFKEIKTISNNESCIILKGEYSEKNQRIANVNIIVNNKIPIYHSNLLKLYALYDQRFHIMGIYLKYWTKINGIHGFPGFLSSYSLLIMIIHFLQKIVEPKVLPNLQKIHLIDGVKSHSDNISEPKFEEIKYEYFHEYKSVETNLYYEKDENRIKEYMSIINNNKVNEETVTNLLVKFFEYYSYYYDSNQKISIHKDLKESIKKCEDNIAFSIEDPFDRMNNPGQNLEKDSENCKKFIKAMKKEVNLILSGEYVKRLEFEKEKLARMNKK